MFRNKTTAQLTRRMTCNNVNLHLTKRRQIDEYTKRKIDDKGNNMSKKHSNNDPDEALVMLKAVWKQGDITDDEYESGNRLVQSIKDNDLKESMFIKNYDALRLKLMQEQSATYANWLLVYYYI